MEPKPAVIVSNDRRNKSRFPYVHIVEVTNSYRLDLSSVAVLDDGECVTGNIRCDNVIMVFKTRLGEYRGQLSARSMPKVDVALRHVFSL